MAACNFPPFASASKALWSDEMHGFFLYSPVPVHNGAGVNTVDEV